MADNYENLSREELIAEIRRLRQGHDQDIQQVGSALRQSDERFRRAMENAPIGMTLTALDGHYLLINHAFCRFLGYAREELYRLTFKDISHPDDFPVDRSAVQQLMTGEIDSYRREKRYLRKDGRAVWGQLTVSLLRDEAGAPLYFIAQVADIDESRQAAEALRKSAEEIEDLYENAPCGYQSLDKDGLFLRINHTELQWLGYRREEVVGKLRFPDLLTPESLQTFHHYYPRFKESGFVQDVEYHLRRKDGSVLPVLLSATAIKGPNGEYLTNRATLYDISARKQAEQALKESEERFRAMADNVPIIIWLADADETGAYRGCNFFNRGWHDFIGLPLEQTKGCHWLALVHPEDREQCRATYVAAFRHTQPFKQVYRLQRHDGEYRWMQDTGTPRFGENGRFLGHVGTCLDITHQVEANAARVRQQNDMDASMRFNIAGEMTSGLTHELSQPVNATLNYLDACLRRLEGGEYDPDKQRQCLRLAFVQAERAGNIINNFKAMIRKTPSQRSPLDLNRLIQDTVVLLEYEIGQHGVNVVFDLEPLPTVLGNPVELQQVLLNLMKNAMEAMHDSSRRNLRLLSRHAGQQVRVEICDSGKGIYEGDLDSIFHPFQTTKRDGLGLGLPICRTLIEAHDGRIWATSIPDGGTCFCFLLPSLDAKA